MAGEGKQILIDIQMRNQNLQKELEGLRKELEAVRKEAKLVEEQDRQLWEQEKKDEQQVKSVTQTLANLQKQEKLLQTQIIALQKEQFKLTQQIEKQRPGVVQLGRVQQDLSGFLQETSDKLMRVREAMLEVDQEENRLITSGEATAEDLDRIQMSAQGLSKAMKRLQKDYADEVKNMMMAAATTEEMVVAEEKVVSATKKHQTGLTQLAMYFNTAGVSGKDFIWVIADMTRQLTWGAAGISSIIGMLAGLGISMLAQTNVVKKWIESFRGTSAHMEEFKKTLGDIDWQALKAGASLSALFAVMQQTAKLSGLTDKLKSNAEQMEKLNVLQKDLNKGWDVTYKSIGNYGDSVESVSKKWTELDKIAKRFNVNLNDVEKNEKNAAMATKMVQDAIDKNNDSIVKTGVVVQKAKEAEESYISSLKEKNKHIQSGTKLQKTSNDTSKETAAFQDYLIANDIKLSHVQQQHFQELIKNGKDWRTELELIAQTQRTQLDTLQKYAEGIGVILTQKETQQITQMLKTSYDEAKNYIDQLLLSGQNVLAIQAASIKDLASKVDDYYANLQLIAGGDIGVVAQLAKDNKALLEQLGVYAGVMDKITKAQAEANEQWSHAVEERIKKDAEYIQKEEQNTQAIIANIEKIAQQEQGYNQLSKEGQNRRLLELLRFYEEDLHNHTEYLRVKTALDKRQADATKAMNQQAKVEIEQNIKAIASSLMTIWNNFYQSQLTSQEENAKQWLANLQLQKDMGYISEVDYISKVNAANWAAKKEKDRILAEQAKAQRAAGIANIMMDTAQGIMKVVKDWSGQPWIMSALIAIVAALSAAQMTALLSAPIPKAEKGGEVKGPSHKQGGVLIEAEGGEYIIPKNIYARNKGLVSAMGAGGVSAGVGVGSIDSAMKDAMQQGNAIVEAIKNMKVYTSIEEVRTADKNYTELINIKI